MINKVMSVSFASGQPATNNQVVVGEVVANSNPTNQIAAKDVAKESKKGPVQGLKDVIRTIKKLFITIGEYSKGTVKGAAYGSLAGLSVFGGTKLIIGLKNLSKRFSKEGRKVIADNADKLADGAKTVAKKASKAPKVLGILTGAGVFISHIWKASIQANREKADVDHGYTNTPVFDNK